MDFGVGNPDCPIPNRNPEIRRNQIGWLVNEPVLNLQSRPW